MGQCAINPSQDSNEPTANLQFNFQVLQTIYIIDNTLESEKEEASDNESASSSQQKHQSWLAWHEEWCHHCCKEQQQQQQQSNGMVVGQSNAQKDATYHLLSSIT